MIGIFIITHGEIGKHLIDSACHILGKPLTNVTSMSVIKTEDPDRKLAQARTLLSQLDQGHGVLVLTDMLGGTPSNIASRLIQPKKIEAVAGINLPMLVRALSYCHESLDIVVGKAVTGGLEGVIYIIPGERQ